MVRFRQAREYLGISQDEVAGFLNGTVRDVERWETGWETPDSETLARLSKLYQRPAALLMGKATPPVEISPQLDRMMERLNDHDRRELVGFAEWLSHRAEAAHDR